nr:MFS transporter [Sphingobacterium daejeonense]
MTFALRDGQVQLNWMYLLMACRSIGSAFHQPALQAVAPLIVPQDQLLRVSGVNQILHSVSAIAGPALGALAIAALPIHQVLYLDIIGAAFAIVSLMFISIPYIKPESLATIRQVWRDLKLGFLAIHQNKGLNRMFLYSILAMMGVLPVAIMFPLMTIGHFGGGQVRNEHYRSSLGCWNASWRIGIKCIQGVFPKNSPDQCYAHCSWIDLRFIRNSTTIIIYSFCCFDGFWWGFHVDIQCRLHDYYTRRNCSRYVG